MMIHSSISCENFSSLMGRKDGLLKSSNLRLSLVIQPQTWKNQAKENADLIVLKR